MNIQQAAGQVEGAVRAYLARDDEGIYLIPPQMQRPIILMGPPGVGKTAIVSQVAEQLGLCFVSYSITHHTRQSALGLPYIQDEEFEGERYKVSRYTMSEIIASVYDAMRSSGGREGILFLDEINCASETLMPSMLQFLQYKTFGQHRLPMGWVIVCAGNPPEYNRAAREFDPAMMDRLKRIDVEPDLDAWMGYAAAHGVHPAITSYLDEKPENFFRVRSTVEGTRVVTARGWEDLSRMLQAYEREGIDVDPYLVGQYLQDDEVAEDFSLYLELFGKYRDDLDVARVLDGLADDATVAHVSGADLDERMAVVSLVESALLAGVHGVRIEEEAVRQVRDILKTLGDEPQAAGAVVSDCEIELAGLVSRGFASDRRRAVCARRLALLRELCPLVAKGGLDGAKGCYNDVVRTLSHRVRRVSAQVDHAIDFMSRAFGEGEETLVFVTRLSVDPEFMGFQAAHGSDSFVTCANALMLQDRGLDLLDRLEALRKGRG